MIFQLDKEIRHLIKTTIGDCKIIIIKSNRGNSIIYKLTDTIKGDFYLKVSANFYLAESLSSDKIIYEWLLGKIPVPKVQFYKKTEKFEALCLTAIEGQNLYDLIGVVSNEDITKIYAQILKHLHSISIKNCNIKISLEEKLKKVKQRISSNQIISEDFEEENRHKSIMELYEELLNKMPEDSELVFTHGDYCFDNLIIKEKKISGLIDIGRGGVADKYQDVALALRNIKHEFGSEYVRLFVYLRAV